MPESKTDQAHRSNEEISNFLECGDARGRQWLDSHPSDRDRADELLRGIAEQRLPQDAQRSA